MPILSGRLRVDRELAFKSQSQLTLKTLKRKLYLLIRINFGGLK